MACLASACASADKAATDGGGSGGNGGAAGGNGGAAGGSGGNGGNGDASGGGEGGVVGGCAAALIALDRSCSMNKVDSAMKSKYSAAAGVLRAVTTEFGDRMSFGLNAFPPRPMEGTKCDPGRIYVDLGLGNATKISDAITAIDPVVPANRNCGTPTGANLEMLLAYMPLFEPTPRRYLILVTDGMPVCDGETVNRSVNRLDKLKTMGVHTFVVGFLANADRMALNMMADAGGEPQPPPAPTRFYNAGDAAELDFAIRTILSKICTDVPPPSCPPGTMACGPGGIDPATCPPGTVCTSGCCLNWVP